jgi:hypothetical protein
VRRVKSCHLEVHPYQHRQDATGGAD